MKKGPDRCRSAQVVARWSHPAFSKSFTFGCIAFVIQVSDHDALATGLNRIPRTVLRAEDGILVLGGKMAVLLNHRKIAGPTVWLESSATRISLRANSTRDLNF